MKLCGQFLLCYIRSSFLLANGRQKNNYKTIYFSFLKTTPYIYIYVVLSYLTVTLLIWWQSYQSTSLKIHFWIIQLEKSTNFKAFCTTLYLREYIVQGKRLKLDFFLNTHSDFQVGFWDLQAIIYLKMLFIYIIITFQNKWQK